MINFDKIDQYLENHLDESIQELSVLSAQPSISAQNLGIKECANLVAEMLIKRGFKTQVYSTGGAPVVFGEIKGRSDKTVLFYNHYDVQPPEPLELWVTPPFQPTLRDGKLFARGVSDDKGHITSRLFAIDALQSIDGELPVNIKFILEGEEETSSVHLDAFVKSHTHELAADACIWEFGGVDSQEVPIQYLGLRGILCVELSVETGSQDVHSGTGGSIFPNAAWRLVWALSTLKGPDEHILIPGFYDAIQPPSSYDMQLLSDMPETADEFKQQYGLKNFIKGLTGGVELRREEVFTPSCTINGLTSGYQGPGSKTVLPCKASAKLDFRLVPDQTPDVVLKQLRAHLDANGFEDVKIANLGGDAPGRTDPNHPFVKVVVEAARDVYGVPMRMVPMVGGSGPNHLFIEQLKVPVVTAGVGYPLTGAHAPNENVRIDLYLQGAKHIARILKMYA